LIIAIENQYGLKYFAGALEDHVGQAMFGIEDRYDVKGVNTFGRLHLQRLLQQAGFAHNDFYAPFPDYKLPVSVVSQAGFDHPVFEGAALASQSSKRDPQLPHTLHFAPDQVWPGLERNGLAMELSNSFLILAQDATTEASGPVPLAWHYSSERRADWCKLTTFEAVGPTVQVRHHRLAPEAPAQVQRGELSNHLQLGQALPYTPGATLASAITRTLMQPQWTRQDLARALQPYLNFVMGLSGRDPHTPFDPALEVPGRWLDAIPQNMIVDASGQVHLIDEEWSSQQAISLGFLLFRTLQACVFGVHRFGHCQDRAVATPVDLVSVALESLGAQASHAQLRQWVDQECALQTLISGVGQGSQARWDYLSQHRLPCHDTVSQLSQDNSRLAAELQAQQALTLAIQRSSWWRLGQPLRSWVQRWRSVNNG